MKVWRFNSRYSARLALAGAVVCGCPLIESPTLAAQQKFFGCTVMEVAVYPGSHIYLRCDPGDVNGTINYFALASAYSDASRVLSLATTGVAARKPLEIIYDPNDLSGAAFCNPANCRLISGISLFRD